MRALLLVVVSVIAINWAAFGARTGNEPSEDPPALHTEKGLFHTIVIEEDVRPQRPAYKDAAGKLVVSGQITYNRLLLGGVLWGSQARKLENNVYDMFQALTALNPLDNVAFAGANHAYNMREEPLTYYHRTGPVGAIFRELRGRKDGSDAKAPVGILGLGAGTETCYALSGQKFTYYEADPALKRLIADTDKYFTYVTDARKRGAEINLRIGNRRVKLKEDKDSKYALLLVIPAESYPGCKDIFTKEAVQLYFDRMTDDGILALHVSSRTINFEPMIARIAKELKLEARIWSDNSEMRPGKTASTWIVLAKDEKALGLLALPVDRQLRELGSQFRPLQTRPDVPAWTDGNTEVVAGMKLR